MNTISGLRFRPFHSTDEDYEILTRIMNSYLDFMPQTPEQVRADDLGSPKGFHQERHLLERDGVAVCQGNIVETFWSHKPGKYTFFIVVDPSLGDGRDYSAMHEHLTEQLRKRDPRILTAWTKDTETDRIEYLTSQGFKETMRAPVSMLNAPQFDSREFQPWVEKVENSGIVIKTIEQLEAAGYDWRPKAWEMERTILVDLPSPDPITTEPYDLYLQRVNDPVRFHADGYFVAIDGERFVGCSMLARNKIDPSRFQTGLTGVLRSHRRRGLATALKVHAITWAQSLGAKTIATDNEQNNPMYQLNVRLGFKAQFYWVDFMKHLKAEDEA